MDEACSTHWSKFEIRINLVEKPKYERPLRYTAWMWYSNTLEMGLEFVSWFEFAKNRFFWEWCL